MIFNFYRTYESAACGALGGLQNVVVSRVLSKMMWFRGEAKSTAAGAKRVFSMAENKCVSL